jgi:hypothetical protein
VYHPKNLTIYMRYLMVWLALLPICALAQELSVDDRACIIALIGTPAFAADIARKMPVQSSATAARAGL